MERKRGCLNDDSIIRFHAGRVDGPARSSIERHVDACAACALLMLPSGAWSATGRQASAHALEPGDLVTGRYRIERLLGGGGMGEVYSAFDEQLGERVALKTLRATIADDARAIARLKSEVQLARRVTHPNVCRIYDLGTQPAKLNRSEQLAFLTMELLPGRTLAEEIRGRGAFPDETARRIMRQIVAGLHAAHRAGVIHKDLKSDNVILVTANSPDKSAASARAVITDFGLAATEQVTSIDRDGRGEFSGTPGYIAPERLGGWPATPASDVYSLGIVLLDMLEGRVPAVATARNAAPARTPSGGLRSIAHRCCDVRPQARPTVDALAAGLASPEQRAPRRSVRTAALAGTAALLATITGLSLWSRPASRAQAVVARPGVEAVPQVESRGTVADAVARPAIRQVPIRSKLIAGRHHAVAPKWASNAHLVPSAPAGTARPESDLTSPARDDEPIRSVPTKTARTERTTVEASDDAIIDPFTRPR